MHFKGKCPAQAPSGLVRLPSGHTSMLRHHFFTGGGGGRGLLPRTFVVRNLFSRAAAGGKFVAWPCLRFKSRVFWSKPIFKTVCFWSKPRFKTVFCLKPIFESMTGRIVLSHLHVSTLRRTWSTQKLIFTGLASGGIITPEYI